MVQDMNAVGFKVNRQHFPDATTRVNQVSDGKGGPMFSWDWGYYSVFDADGILWDIHHSQRAIVVLEVAGAGQAPGGGPHGP